MKILLITRECLRTDSNEGNVLLNLFGGQNYELANIYCKSGVPDVDVCAGRYFQLTDRMALQKLLRGTPMGRVVTPQSADTAAPDAASKPAAEQENKRFYNFFRSHNWEVFYLAQELLRAAAGFRSPALDAFLDDFSPDVIFAPACYSRFVLALQRYCIRRTGAPAATYLYDDLYSLRQLRFSPFYWLNRFLLRGALRKTLACHKLAFTMTEQQAAEYGQMLQIPIRVLRKAGPAAPIPPVPHPENGVRLLYAGGIYYGRDDTLAAVADAVRTLRAEGQNVRLDVFTSSPLRPALAARLNDGEASTVHGAIPFAALQREYAASDIALHVESFQRKNALLTRLSFSTKIVDCLASGCAVLAICPDINAGWQYLRDEQAAECVSDPTRIAAAVRALVTQPAYRAKLAARAADCLAKNHDEATIRSGLRAELEALAAGKAVGK